MHADRMVSRLFQQTGGRRWKLEVMDCLYVASREKCQEPNARVFAICLLVCFF